MQPGQSHAAVDNATSSPKAVAQTFFSSLANGDDNKAFAMLRGAPDNDPGFMNTPRAKEILQAMQLCKGMTVKRIGEPFMDAQKRGWCYVPYVIQASDGEVRKGNLLLRNDDTPAKQWKIDGGF